MSMTWWRDRREGVTRVVGHVEYLLAEQPGRALLDAVEVAA
jgi:hypothetical protein